MAAQLVIKRWLTRDREDARAAGGPLVSVLCVTNRPAFRRFLRFVTAHQTYPRVECIVVEDRGAHQPVGKLFELAMRLARGELFVWLGDDDWQHPQKIEHLVRAAQEHPDAPYLGWDHGWFMRLTDERTQFFQGAPVLASAAIFRTDAVRNIEFDERPRCSDTRWMQRLEQRLGPGRTLPRAFIHSLWTYHGANMHTRDYAFDGPHAQTLLGGDTFDWAPTAEQLAHLRTALRVGARWPVETDAPGTL